MRGVLEMMVKVATENKWLRRSISVPLLIGATLAGVALFPVMLCLFTLVDGWRDRRFPMVRAGCIVVFYGVWEMFGILAALGVYLFSGVWAGLGRARYHDWNYALQRFWVQGFAWVGLRLFSMPTPIEEKGYAFSDRPVLLLVRHTSLADTILATYLMRVRRAYRLRFVMKRELLWDPCLDIVGNRIPNYFVDRHRSNTLGEAQALATLADGLGEREGVIVWPESTRFSPAKRVRALNRLREQGDDTLLQLAADMKYVLPPRLGGILALLAHNPGMDVVFCAHTGFEEAASFAAIFKGSMIRREIRVKFWGYSAEEIPRDRAQQKQWIYENWRQVDAFVATACQDAISGQTQ